MSIRVGAGGSRSHAWSRNMSLCLAPGLSRREAMASTSTWRTQDGSSAIRLDPSRLGSTSGQTVALSSLLHPCMHLGGGIAGGTGVSPIEQHLNGYLIGWKAFSTANLILRGRLSPGTATR